jgi:acyl-CoA thioesterase I
MRFASLALLLSALVARPALAQSPPADSCASIAEQRDRFKQLAYDFSNLGFYRDADAKMTSRSTNEQRVVFFGDSITELWNLDAYFPGKSYVNRGISGQTTPEMLIRFRQDVIALKPKVVVILAGTNDIAENTGPTTLEAIENNLASMVDLARQNGIRVVLASLLPVARYSWRPEIEPQAKITALNLWIKDYSHAEGLTLLDYYSSTVDNNGGMKAALSNDGVHPNKDGYAVMSPLAEKAVADALGRK